MYACMPAYIHMHTHTHSHTHTHTHTQVFKCWCSKLGKHMALKIFHDAALISDGSPEHEVCLYVSMHNTYHLCIIHIIYA